MKINRPVFIISLFALLLTACAEESIIGNGTAESVSEPAVIEEITFWHTYSDIEALKFTKEVIPAFEKEHPEINVNAVRKPYESMKRGLISQATARSGPDVVRMDMVWIPEFAKLGLIEPVDGNPEFQAVKSKLYPSALETSFYNGRYYGVPLNQNTKAAIYNRRMLKEAGLDEPPRTMDQLIRLVRESGSRMGVGGYHPWGIMPYFMGLGGRFTDESYTKAAGYLDSPASVRAVETLKQLMKEGIIETDYMTGKANRWTDIEDGALLMMDEGPWFFSILSQLDDHRLAQINQVMVAAPFPQNPGSNAAIIGGESLVMMKGTPHRKSAWTFIQWMSGVTGQKLMFETGLIPTNIEASRDPAALANPAIRPYVDSLDHSFLRPPVPQWEKIDNEFAVTFELLLEGRVPVQEGLTALAVRIEHLLSPAT